MFIITANQDGQTRKIVSNWQGVIAFMRMNIDAAEYREVCTYVSESLAAGYVAAGWQWANGDSFEVYYPENESLPSSVEPPVVNNSLRKVLNAFVSAIL